MFVYVFINQSLSWAHGNKIAADYQSAAIFHLPLCCDSIALPYGRQANIRMQPQQAHSTNLSRGGGTCGRPRPFSNPCAYVPPLVQQSSARYANDPQAGKRPAIRPQYFDAKSIKPEKFRRTGKFRVGKNRGKGIFQQSEGPENLYNIRNCSYTKYLLSNICK